MAETPETRAGKHRHGATTRRTLLVVAGVLSFLLAVGSGLSIAQIHRWEGTLTKYCAGSGCDKANPGGHNLIHVEPFCKDICNYLILGSDSRAQLTKRQQGQFGSPTLVTGQRSDTIIVVRVNAAANRTVILNIPRDLRVQIPGHGLDKINSAFQYGADTLVQAVEQLTGLTINPYVEVNFAGFINVVNAIGGVPICVDHAMVDTLSGLNLPRGGCYNLQGAQALSFVRARHVQGDAIPDFSRIARQQQFMRAIIDKVISPKETFRINQIVNAVKDNLVIDQNLNIYSVQDLTRKLAVVGQQGVTFRVVPAIPVTIDGGDYVQLQQPQARNLFAKIRKNQYLGTLGKEEPGGAISPANITVRLEDAASGGAVKQVESFLKRAGFVVLPVTAAPPGQRKSEILYGTEAGKEKAVVSSYLPRLSVVFDRHPVAGADVTVIVGPDFSGLPS